MSDKRTQYTSALSALALVALSDDTRKACQAAGEAMGATTSGIEGRDLAYGPALAVLVEASNGNEHCTCSARDATGVIRHAIAALAFQAVRESSSERLSYMCGTLRRYSVAFRNLTDAPADASEND